MPGASPAAAWSSPRHRWARWNCSSRLREKGSLPAISEHLGKQVRTNSESLIGVRVPGSSEDLSQGSGYRIRQFTSMSTLTSKRFAIRRLGHDGHAHDNLTDGRPGPGRIGLWLKNLCLLAAPSFQNLALFRPMGWAREAVILLCMQALEGHIDMQWERHGSGRSGSCWSAVGARCPLIFPRPTSSPRNSRRLPGARR